jgi:hypothetical protein
LNKKGIISAPTIKNSLNANRSDIRLAIHINAIPELIRAKKINRPNARAVNSKYADKNFGNNVFFHT